VSFIDVVYATLQQDGYQPQIGEHGLLHFRYYGQQGTLGARSVGQHLLAELSCTLPIHAPDQVASLKFAADHPLASLSTEGERTLIRLTSLLSEQGVAGQTRALLALLEEYAADAVWTSWKTAPGAPLMTEPTRNDQPVLSTPSSVPAMPAAPPVQSAEVAAPEATPAPSVPPVPAASPLPPALDAGPDGWGDFWRIMNARFRPLAWALANQGVRPPDDMHADMLQGQIVRGTAVLIWGAAPRAVVVCEAGQRVPDGYHGVTLLPELSPGEVATSVEGALKKWNLA
jgi:hypothetical protein